MGCSTAQSQFPLPRKDWPQRVKSGPAQLPLLVNALVTVTFPAAPNLEELSDESYITAHFVSSDLSINWCLNKSIFFSSIWVMMAACVL
jgi:hypothetical protein